MDPHALDLSNQFQACTVQHGDPSLPDQQVALVNPPLRLLDAEQALALAAWLVRVAEPISGVSFAVIRAAVSNL